MEPCRNFDARLFESAASYSIHLVSLQVLSDLTALEAKKKRSKSFTICFLGANIIV